MIPFLLWPLAAILGWLAGAGANWAADVLPGLRDEAQPQIAASFWPHLLQGRPRWPRVPALQIATAVLFVLAVWRLGGRTAPLLAAWLYIPFLLAVLVIDLEHRRVLNVMLAPAAPVVVLLSLLPGMPGLVPSLLGGAAGLGLFVIVFFISRGKMGAGDVKLAGLIGLMLGYPAALNALVWGIILGGVAALLLLVTRKVGRKSYMAYAPYLSAGALIVLLRLWGG
jgi:prepilin signal peptidase PulO-like enzyme (type II secretory pathway)